MQFKKWQIGELRNGFPVKYPHERKTILLLADDARTFSGVATICKELISNTCHYYNWIQLGAAVDHIDTGKKFVLDESTEEITGVPNPRITIYANNNYGNPQLLRNLLEIEGPDAIMIFTDPRYWIWLFNMEQEIRQNYPIIYYNIWDDLPYPQYNRSYYTSCDLIMNISKQTHNIVKNVLSADSCKELTI